jgi:TatD DNase family protein
MSLLIDCHAHLYPPYCTLDDLEAGFGVSAARMPICVVVTECYDDIHALDTWLALPSVTPLAQRIALCVGLHPMQRLVDTGTCTSIRVANWLASRTDLEAYANSSFRVVGIGEIGLDFSPHILATHPDGAEAAREEQRVVFKAQLELARRLNLPVNVHSRQAGRHVLDILRETGYRADSDEQAPKVLLHAFDGRPKYIKEGLALGVYFSVAPSLARDPMLERLVQQVPIDRLVLESDTPALGMIRGERSTPAQVEWVCQRIAELKGMAASDVATITTNNAYRIFPKLRAILA